MSSVSEVVQASFGDVSFGLNRDHLLELVNVIDLQVNDLLSQYLEARDNVAAIPAQVAIMVQRLIGDLGSNLPSIQDRMKDKLQELLMTIPKISLEYIKSLREVAKSLTGFTQLSKTTILPKLKLFLGTAGPIEDSVEYLIGLGFTEPTAEFLYNKDKCKDLFSCMLIVLCYLFIMKIPPPTGVQGLRGIIVAEADASDLTNSHAAVGQGLPDQGQFAMLLAMMAESQRSVAALTGLVNQLRSDYSALSNQGQTLPDTGSHLPNPRVPSVGYTTAFAEQESDSDDAILLATIQSMQQGTLVPPPALPVQGTQIAVGQGILDARAQMLADFAKHREDWTWSDILLAVTSGGIKVVGVDGLIHLFSRPHVKHSTPSYRRILTVFYNPDNLSSINSLPAQFRNPHLYPTSVDHLFQLLQNEFLRCGELQDLTYRVLPGLTVNQTNARHLANYTRLLKQLCTNVLQGTTNEKVQSNPHHITTYFTILCFHYNRYTRAVVHKDLGILVTDFFNHWILHYAPLLALNADGNPMLPLSDALEALSYVCDCCGRFATARQFCPGTDCQARSKISSAPPKPANTGSFYPALRKYRLKDGKKDATEKEFRASPEYKALPPTERSSAPATPSSVVASAISFSHRQHEIPIPALLALSY